MRLVFLILAIVTFLLAALGVQPNFHVAVLPLGLAFLAISFLPWKE